MPTKGTKEWADKNVNVYKGCYYNCKYCYARKMALRYGRINKPEEWTHVKPKRHIREKNWKKIKGRIMFQSTSDLFPGEWVIWYPVLEKILKAGNRVLITTKPNFDVIQGLVIIKKHLHQFKKLIQFRFTITTHSSKQMKWWEPGAPGLQERLKCLKTAFNMGYKTSVSIEPMLTDQPMELVKKIYPYCTESIWIGTINNFNLNDAETPEEEFYYNKIRKTKELCFLTELEKKIRKYENHNGRNIIRFKDSIRNILSRNDRNQKSLESYF
ncbi:MAG: hypothetical protein GF353_28655 [Candidatus Lokiarchaeota archaeon]|nr:hypothetical protein [Candidatus Lokiarchaeota archaeon]MBD3353974.1 hypothetical protein [Candidatus Lokiarchaeota archaeon]